MPVISHQVGQIGGFRNSLCDVIFAHAHIAGRQYNGQHNGQAYGIHVKNVEIKLLYRKFIALNFLFNNNTYFRLKAHLFPEIVLIKYSEMKTEDEVLADKTFCINN